MCSTKTHSTRIPAFFVRLLILLASVTFSANALADPQIVKPSAGSTLSGSAQTFGWNIDSEDIESVWLYVGTTAGGRDIANSGDLGKDTQYKVIGIPVDGSTIHTRLWYYSASRWFYVDGSYTAADLNIQVSTPAMISPANNSKFTGTSVDFEWSDNNTQVNYWWLYLGTTEGERDLYDSGEALRTRTSFTFDELPTDGSSVYARLWYRTTVDGWQFVDSVYQPQPTPSPAPIANIAPDIKSISLGCNLVTESVSIKMGETSEFFLLIDDESPLELDYVIEMQKPDIASVSVDSEGMLRLSGLALGRTGVSVKVVDSQGLSDTVWIRLLVEL